MVDNTFHGLFHSLGVSIATVTIIVSIGKLYSVYYFYYIIFILCLILIAISYIDKLRRRPVYARNTLQNYICSFFEHANRKRVDTALYSILEQQHVAFLGTHKAQSINQDGSCTKLGTSSMEVGSPIKSREERVERARKLTLPHIMMEEKKAGRTRKMTLPHKFENINIRRKLSIGFSSHDKHKEGIGEHGCNSMNTRVRKNNLIVQANSQ